MIYLHETSEENLLKILSILVNGEYQKVKITECKPIVRGIRLAILFDDISIYLDCSYEEKAMIDYIEAKVAQKDLFETFMIDIYGGEHWDQRYDYLYRQGLVSEESYYDEELELSFLDVYTKEFAVESIKMYLRTMDKTIEELLTGDDVLLRELAKIAVEEQQNATT